MFNALFVVLNSGVLCAVLWYAWRNFGVGYFLEDYDLEQKQEQDLYLKLHHIDTSGKELESAFTDQIFLYEMLNTRVFEWGVQIELEKNDLAMRQAHQDDLLRSSLKKQCFLMYQKIATQQHVPIIVQRVEQQLVQNYATDKRRGREFVSRVCERCKKSMQGPL